MRRSCRDHFLCTKSIACICISIARKTHMNTRMFILMFRAPTYIGMMWRRLTQLYKNHTASLWGGWSIALPSFSIYILLRSLSCSSRRHDHCHFRYTFQFVEICKLNISIAFQTVQDAYICPKTSSYIAEEHQHSKYMYISMLYIYSIYTERCSHCKCWEVCGHNASSARSHHRFSICRWRKTVSALNVLDKLRIYANFRCIL